MLMIIRAFLVVFALAIAILAGAIGFGTGAAPSAWEAGNTIPGIASWDLAEIPKPQTVKARDGTGLAYRAYPGTQPVMAVLVHGSTGSSYSMHRMAQELNRSGASVYALDIRGHGGTGAKGDIGYMGQIDDDLADFMNDAVKRQPGAKKILIGFSAGGGFTLRTAGGKNRELFDGYIMLAPYLRFDAPTTRPDTNDKWSTAFVPRIAGLKLLERLGLNWFQGLTTVAFAVPPDAGPERTGAYSYRLMFNFGPHWDWQSDVRNINKPAALIVGSNDEFFLANAYAPTLQPLRPELKVTVLPGLKHLDLLAESAAVATIGAAFTAITGAAP